MEISLGKMHSTWDFSLHSWTYINESWLYELLIAKIEYNSPGCPDFIAVNCICLLESFPTISTKQSPEKGNYLSKIHHCPRTGVDKLFISCANSAFWTTAPQMNAISSAAHMLLEVVQRHMESESLLQGEDSTTSAEGRKQANWVLAMHRWSQDCACLAHCSVSPGNSHRPPQSHSHQLRTVGPGEAIRCFDISCREIQRQTS